MKKLAIILTSMIALTVGGVYATFNYATQEVDSVNTALSKTISDKTEDTPKGTITLISNSKLVVDDYDNNLTTSYRWEGKTTVKFTPHPNAAQNVKDYGILLSLTFVFHGNATYQDGAVLRQIYDVKDVDVYGAGAKINGDNPVLNEFEIDLNQYLGVNSFSLPTPSDYDRFAKSFNETSIQLIVKERQII